jgi:hypothetical protein
MRRAVLQGGSVFDGSGAVPAVADVLSIHRGLLLFVRGWLCETPSLDRLGSSRGAEAPLLHRIRYGAVCSGNEWRNERGRERLACTVRYKDGTRSGGPTTNQPFHDYWDHQTGPRQVREP